MSVVQLAGVGLAGAGFGIAFGLCIAANMFRKAKDNTLDDDPYGESWRLSESFGPVLPSSRVASVFHGGDNR